MDKNQRKQMQEAWKNRRPDMGVLCIRCTATGDAFLLISKDAANGFNRHRFQLSAGMHPNKCLQTLWQQYGEDGFAFTAAGLIEYDDPQGDQSEKLEALLEKCLEGIPGAKKL